MRRILLFMCFMAIICIGCSTKSDPYAKFKGRDLHLKNGDKELFWFSGIHNNDPEHEMFDDIKKQFISFKPDYVLVEGNADKQTYENETNARLNGESAYVAYLAVQSNIEVGTMEPSNEAQLHKLLGTYKEDDILAMYMLRQIYQMKRESQNVDINFFEYMIPFIKRYITGESSYSSTDIDKEFIIRILEHHIRMKIDNDNWKQVDAYSIVYDKNGLIHSIYNDVLNYRDEYSVNVISDKLKGYNRVFIMMGADHIKSQEKELRKLFDNMQ